MVDTELSRLRLGSPPGWRRVWNVTWVGIYLGAAFLLLIVTLRLRVDTPAIRRFLRRQLGGNIDDPARTQAREAAPATALASVPPAPGSPPDREEEASSANTAAAAGADPREWPTYHCPHCHAPLVDGASVLTCPAGHRFPVVRDIPRFVRDSAYLESFSREWNTHDRTQLDSELQAPISEQTLRTKLGITPEDVAGKLVLDAGVGAGRYAEVLARWGAEVIGVDLSLAVEAAHRNLAAHPTVHVAQADLMACPFAPGTFDWIVSIGVLHHTPDTRLAVDALIPLLKPGGTLAAWVYPDEGPYRTRACWIPFTSRLPPDAFYDWCSWLVRFTHRHPGSPLLWPLRLFFPFSEQGLGIEWDVLDTFDGYSPRYHGVHGPSEVIAWFREAGLIDVREAGPIHTAVRGCRPLVTSPDPG